MTNNLTVGILAVLLVAVLFTAFSMYMTNIAPGNDLTGNAVTGTSDNSGSGTQEMQQMKQDTSMVDGDYVEGDANAPITIIEYSDFQCPYCQRFYSQTLSQIRTNYIDTGKAKLIFRDFPLSFHQYAEKAAEAAECAGEQGMFWEMHDVLFDSGKLSVSDLKQHAKDLGLDSAQFDSCLDSGKYADEVQADVASGSAAGVTGTPSFVINGKLLVGAQPYEVFQQVLDQELGQ